MHSKINEHFLGIYTEWIAAAIIYYIVYRYSSSFPLSFVHEILILNVTRDKNKQYSAAAAARGANSLLLASSLTR